MRAVQFYRNYRSFTGGHLKVFHYFQHFQSLEGYRPSISFTPGSILDATNPWYASAQPPFRHEELDRPDVFFLAGLDWLRLERNPWSKDPCKPMINLIQGVQHAEPANIRYQFLKNRALRICVGEEIKDAILGTGIVNGPLTVIPNAIDCQYVRDIAGRQERDIDLLIICNKQREMGMALASTLGTSSLRLWLHATPTPRDQLIRLLGRASVTLFLPSKAEGFYLPALEGMAAGTLVVCPDCIGNRSFCLPDHNCFRPEYELDAIVSAVGRACALSMEERGSIRLRAERTASERNLDGEREALRLLLADLDQIW